MLRNHKQCLLDVISFQMAEHSKGGQSLKRVVVAQKNYVTSIDMFTYKYLNEDEREGTTCNKGRIYERCYSGNVMISVCT
jgi:hypothetical protein